MSQISIKFIEIAILEHNKKNIELKYTDNKHLCQIGESILQSIITDYLCRNNTYDAFEVLSLKTKLLTQEGIIKLGYSMNILAEDEDIEYSWYDVEELIEVYIGLVYLNLGFDTIKSFIVSSLENLSKIEITI